MNDILPLKFPKPGKPQKQSRLKVDPKGILTLVKPEKRKGEKRDKWGTLEQYKAVCLQRFKEENGLCQDCKVKINEPKYHNFNHTAGRTKNFLNGKTIEVLCMKCHSGYHGISEKNGTWLN